MTDPGTAGRVASDGGGGQRPQEGCVCVYSRTLPSALCANVELKRPLHCAGSFLREKAIESVSSEWIEAGLKLTVNEDLAGVENKLPLDSTPSTLTSPRLTHPSISSQCLFDF